MDLSVAGTEKDIDIEDARTADEDPNKGIDNVDNDEGWVDEFQLLEEEEREQLTDSIRPLKLVLVKVRFQNSEQLQIRLTNQSSWQLRKLAYKIIHSTTIILPAWKTILNDLELPIRIIPRDVSTRWNSTFDMLDFALEYRKAIDAITDTRKLGLGAYELNEEEWSLVRQLRDVLKVLSLTFTHNASHVTWSVA